MNAPPVHLSATEARRIWLHAQRLDSPEPFGAGPEATPAAVAHLGYLQIDTIHVIERSHHHILHSRIPSYRREHLHQAQSVDKTVFEYWTHALSYLPTESLRFYVRQMRREWEERVWFGTVSSQDLRRVVSRIRRDGPITIRDLDNDALVEKIHAWGSRKPSKRVLEAAFYKGLVTISRRTGMLKTYELLPRHFGWDRLPRAASERETLDYRLDRALRAQGVVSVESICYQDAAGKPAMRRLVESRVRRKELVPVVVEGAERLAHWVRPAALESLPVPAEELVHILSPFDPLIIQRKRLRLFFGYDYRFEAYVPRDKRVFGYFVCPVLIGDRIVAGLDLKTDRERQQLLVRRWNWVGRGTSRTHRQRVEAALHRFEQFQLGQS
ncbi:MAG TPA: crosslink repair DNA glycosylase YcaQ family protein [Gemmatimonadales bacterium]|nr:crosslink repair DNA glycosylase YcaQ family protein [Gemmatimonadales bacterium]